MSTKPKHSEISLLFTCGTNRCLAIQNKAAGRILRVCSVGLFKWLTPCMCFRVAAVLWPGNSGWQICSTATASQWLKARLLTEGTSAFRRCTDRSVRQEHGCEKTHVTSLTASVEQTGFCRCLDDDWKTSQLVRFAKPRHGSNNQFPAPPTASTIRPISPDSAKKTQQLWSVLFPSHTNTLLYQRLLTAPENCG